MAMIEHPPAFGKKLQSFDASEALKMPGIDIFLCLYILKIMSSLASDTWTFNDLLVVVGNTTWEVMNARKKTKSNMAAIESSNEIIAGSRENQRYYSGRP